MPGPLASSKLKSWSIKLERIAQAAAATTTTIVLVIVTTFVEITVSHVVFPFTLILSTIWPVYHGPRSILLRQLVYLHPFATLPTWSNRIVFNGMGVEEEKQGSGSAYYRFSLTQ